MHCLRAFSPPRPHIEELAVSSLLAPVVATSSQHNVLLRRCLLGLHGKHLASKDQFSAHIKDISKTYCNQKESLSFEVDTWN